MINAEEFAAAVKELYHWQRTDKATNFTALLYTLISKSDPHNRFKLACAFPEECRAFQLWQTARDENEFFRTWLGEEFVRGGAHI